MGSGERGDWGVGGGGGGGGGGGVDITFGGLAYLHCLLFTVHCFVFLFHLDDCQSSFTY